MRIIPLLLLVLSLIGCAKTPLLYSGTSQNHSELETIFNNGSKGNQAQISVQGDTIRAHINNAVLFDFDRYHVKQAFLPTLQRLATYLKNNHSTFLVVEGHTDSMGEYRYNQQLSLWRAQAVKQVFVYYGVAPFRVKTLGYGEDRPIAGAPDRQNRRVEMVFIAKRSANNTLDLSREHTYQYHKTANNNE